jgi:hypothetical protein
VAERSEVGALESLASATSLSLLATAVVTILTVSYWLDFLGFEIKL